ncbi:hypothetical protein GGR58DRAFT_128313 [Xylaria digitata]|nr:hypothetical protein GGR58DRAFT_128313 [Xylaria digitata]
MCRTAIHCPDGHGFQLEVYGSTDGDATRQGTDITKIRATLKDGCERCNQEREQSYDEGEDAEQSEARRVLTIHGSSYHRLSVSIQSVRQDEMIENYGYTWDRPQSGRSEVDGVEEDFPPALPTPPYRLHLSDDEIRYRLWVVTRISSRLRRSESDSESDSELSEMTQEELDGSSDREAWEGLMEEVAREISEDSWEAEYHEIFLADLQQPIPENGSRRLRLRRWR